MKRMLVSFLVIVAFVTGMAFIACGGGDDDKDNDKPAATKVVENDNEDAGVDDNAAPTKEPTAKKNSGGSGGDFAGVPVYPGADETMKGEWSGAEAMVPGVGLRGADPADFDTVKYGMYESDDSPEDVFLWYKDNMGDWNEDWVFARSGSIGGGGMSVWSKDDGKSAAWILVSEDSGKTSLTIMSASQ
jgi:hypothetical protein